MEQTIFLPTLHSFENQNTYSGSCGRLRFFLYPQENTILAKIWHGPFCIEKSTVEAEQTFPMTQQGLEALRAYLTEQIDIKSE